MSNLPEKKSPSVEGIVPPKEKSLLTLVKAKGLFELSFLHSQGSAELQRGMFYYLHSLHPEWEMPGQLVLELFQTVVEPFRKLLLQKTDAAKPSFHKAQNEESITKNIDRMLSAFYLEMSPERVIRASVLDLDVSSTDVPLLLYLAFRMVKKDAQYLENSTGRLRINLPETGTYNPRTDVWLSHVIYYGLDEHSTGQPEFDHMYVDVVNAIRASLKDIPPPTDVLPELYRDLVNIITIYYQKHPTFEMPQLTKELLDTLTARVSL